MTTLIGYARVSTHDQTTDAQEADLRKAGCDRIFREQVSGTAADRPQLAEALNYLRAGDTLVVWRLDRLGRSLRHLIETVTVLGDRGIGLRSLHEGIDTTTASGRMVFHIFGALAEFERELIVDRTKAGLAAAAARGSRPGRPRALTQDQVQVVRDLSKRGDHTIKDIAAIVGTSRQTVYRALART